MNTFNSQNSPWIPFREFNPDFRTMENVRSVVLPSVRKARLEAIGIARMVRGLSDREQFVNEAKGIRGAEWMYRTRLAECEKAFRAGESA